MVNTYKRIISFRIYRENFHSSLSALLFLLCCLLGMLLYYLIFCKRSVYPASPKSREKVMMVSFWRTSHPSSSFFLSFHNFLSTVFLHHLFQCIQFKAKRNGGSNMGVLSKDCLVNPFFSFIPSFDPCSTYLDRVAQLFSEHDHALFLRALLTCYLWSLFRQCSDATDIEFIGPNVGVN